MLNQNFKTILINVSIIGAVFFIFEYLPVKNRASASEIELIIWEGSSVREINSLLHDRGILNPAANLWDTEQSLEGYLFPDTYRFYKNSDSPSVLKRFFDNFKIKAEPFLNQDPTNFHRNLILASLIEKEVPDFSDRKIVAGILLKRLATGMPLQVDATLCYLKNHTPPYVDEEIKSCYPITTADKKYDSPFNTYLYSGLPVAPISNPGLAAIKSVLAAEDSPYWFYLSDPKTNRTIFSRTLAEHNSNRVRYLSKK